MKSRLASQDSHVLEMRLEPFQPNVYGFCQPSQLSQVKE
jgi:hypothetical protein